MVGNGSLQNVFRDYTCSRVRMIHGHSSMVMSFLYHYYYYYENVQTNGVIHGEKSVDVGSDRTIKIISLYLIYSCFYGLVCGVTGERSF